MGCGGSKQAGGGGAGEQALDEGTFMFFKKVKLLKRLPEEELPALAKKAEHVDFAAGKNIITQGDEGNEFFMIKKGTADVEIDGKKSCFIERWRLLR